MIDFTNSNMLAASLFVEELWRLGVKHVVLSPGSRSTPLTVAAARHKNLQTTVHYDERGAAFCALGIARATGVAPALICTSGTAVANYLPAVIEASNDELPLILLTADRPPELQNCGSNQTIQQPGIFGSFARDLIELEPPHEEGGFTGILQAADHAWTSAQSLPRGPVHVNWPFREPLAPVTTGENLQKAREQLQHWSGSDKPYNTAHTNTLTADSTRLTQAAKLLSQAERGLVIVGRLITDDERSAVRELTGQLKWPVFGDLTSGVGRSHDDCGVPHYDLLLVSDQFRGSYSPDVILHLGGRFVSKRLVDYIEKSNPKHYIHAHNSPACIDPARTVTLSLTGQLEHICESLKSSPDVRPSETMELWIQLSREVESLIERSCLTHSRATEINIAREWAGSFHDTMPLWTASSMPIRLLDRYVSAGLSEEEVLANRGASGIDGTVASVCGYALGSAGPMTLLTGDLALLHDLNSLSLVKNSQHPIIIVVLNNNGGRIFEHLPIAQHDDVFEQFFVTPHDLKFDSAARMFGLSYVEAGTVAEFASACEAVLLSQRSGLIEVHIDPQTSREHHRQICDLVSERCGELIR